MTDTNKEGLYTSAKNLLPNDAHSEGCGCGHDHAAGTGTRNGADADAARGVEVHYERPRDQHVDQHVDHAQGEGCGCGCGHDHGARGDEAARGEEAKDYTDPDVVREDGTNPAVRTVDEAEGYNQDAAWNDGVRPEAAGNAEASGASDSDKEQIN